MKVIEREKEIFAQSEANGGVNIEEQIDVEDCCFAMNIGSIVPVSKNGGKAEIELQSDFVGVISLQSTTISDFHHGILAGYNSIINLDKSSLINIRGTAIKVVHPRIFKMSSSVIQKVEEDGVDIKLIQPKLEKNILFSEYEQ